MDWLASDRVLGEKGFGWKNRMWSGLKMAGNHGKGCVPSKDEQRKALKVFLLASIFRDAYKSCLQVSTLKAHRNTHAAGARQGREATQMIFEIKLPQWAFDSNIWAGALSSVLLFNYYALKCQFSVSNWHSRSMVQTLCQEPRILQTSWEEISLTIFSKPHLGFNPKLIPRLALSFKIWGLSRMEEWTDQCDSLTIILFLHARLK